MASMSYEEMITLLQQGGVDPKEFNKKSHKSLKELYKEITGRDVKLVLVDSEEGLKVHRIARSVKVIVDTRDGYEYHEVARRYKRGLLVRSHKDWALSETCKIGESHRQAAVAGFKEEWELDVKPEDLNFRDYAMPDTAVTYQSSVYFGIYSTVYMQWASLTLRERPWPEEQLKIVKDKSVEVHIACFKKP